jgi:hypothetical protein
MSRTERLALTLDHEDRAAATRDAVIRSEL